MALSRRHMLIAIAAAAATLAPAASQAQTFTLTVPLRSDGDPLTNDVPDTARVRVVFESAAIGPGPQVSIDGGTGIAPATTCVANPATCNAVGTFGPGGGDVAFVRWTSNTRLEVALQFNTDFSGSLCASQRTGNRALSVGLTNVTATGYRMASYTVPELVTVANPAPKCDVAFRRVNSNRAFLGVVGGVSNLGRLPLDVVLVLDKSGSMGWDIPGAPGVKRFARLEAAVGQFMGLWEQAVAAGVEGSDDDRVGLVFFDGTAQDGLLDGGSIFRKRSQSWDDVDEGDVVSAHLLPPAPEVTPGGSTSLGGGIDRAKVRWDALAASGPNDPTFVVFTDGEQNTPPCVLAAGEADASPCTTTMAPPLQVLGTPLRNYSVPILTIGLGANAGPFAELLDQISHETAGQSKIAANGVALDLGFADQLVGALKGNTISLMGRRVETLPQAGGTPLSVRADGSVKRIVFVLGWEGMRSPRAVALEIRDPNGTLVTPVVTSGGPSYFVASVDVPSSGPLGQWQAQVVRTPATDGTIRYHLSGYAVEGRLDYRLTVPSVAVGTDEPVVVRAEVAYDGQPLDGLPADALRVVVERPGENLGTILSLTEGAGTAQTEGGQSQSPVGAKIDKLANDDKLLERIAPGALPNVLAMTPLGKGVYEAAFDQTVVGGQYRFRVDMNWDDPRTSRILRAELLERQVPVLPTEAATDVQVTQPPDSTTAQILITPKDRFGNFVGPGYAGLFKVQVAAPASAGVVADPSLNGTYVIPISGLTAGADPRVTITYRGRTIRDAPLSNLPVQGRRFSVGLRFGAGVPHGSLGSAFDGGPAFDADLEYAVSSTFSLQALFGYNRFGDSGSGELDVLRFSVNAKLYLGTATTRAFVNAGAGAYAFDPGDTEPGANFGAGVLRDLTSRLGLEAAYNYHLVDTAGSRSTFSTFEAGIRIRF
jgi:hypothetical protein